MHDPVVIPLRIERLNLSALRRVGVKVNGTLTVVPGSDGVYELHVEGDGPDPFPARDEPPR